MAASYTWDIFCRVIDNLGDVGVCWRLCADLAERGHRVRLWVDQPQPLRWMAPGALEGRWPRVQVRHWLPHDGAPDPSPPADVWIEGFGCEPDAGLLARRFADPGAPSAAAPVWINLEYLSAEPFAARVHRLPSPIAHGPARGQTRWFFYPGLTSATGGLLRELQLAQRQARFERADWLSQRGIGWAGEALVSLFCYEPASLPAMLQQLARGPAPSRLLVAHGRGAQAVRAHLGLTAGANHLPLPDGAPLGATRVHFLEPLPQPEFDHLLWACDLNYVRGEDSLVRALWAGKPFVWQIYPQQDHAHHPKLLAMLQALAAPPSWTRYHRVWNGLDPGPLPVPEPAQWAPAVAAARSSLWQQSDLCQRLCGFVDELRAGGGGAAKQS